MFSPSIILYFSLLCLCLALNLVFVTCSSSSLRNTSSSNYCREDEYDALLHLKGSLSFTQKAYTSYPITNKTRSWKRGSDCCEWDGIICHPFTHHVVALDLSINAITGAIHSNSSLFQLGQLRSLNLSLNDFSSSTISHKFGQFHFLKHLDLSSSNFVGRVPLEISQLTKLTSLDLSWNIDLEFSNVKLVISNLTRLQRLDLSFIKLVSQIFQTITNLSSLSYLNLDGCHLQGEFPTSILNLPHLKNLFLEWNDAINFHFPSLYNWSIPLEYLSLSYTNFSSNMPFFFSRLQHLKSLSLGYTNLHGTIPFWVWNISEALDLSGNELTGSLPSTMNTSKLSSLTYLDLGSNMLVGEVPDWLFSLKSLENIDLSYNNFRGSSVSLYQVFSNLPKLQSLSLSNSGLSVTITDGPVDSAITSTLANSLQALELSNTNIHGEFPRWLQQLVRESSMNLDVSYNYLTGVLENIPWGNSNNIEISNNKLTGRLPIVSSPHTELFAAANNKFTGPIDSSICNMTSLWALDLSNNSLSGNFPHCLGSLSNGLILLSLGSNNIHGTLPKNISKCNSLQYLDLSSNRLQGQLPRSLARCTSLQAINLRNNSFMDEFPHWLHTLPGIQVLDLSSNSFHGHINNISEYHPYPALQILDLSSNNFSGKIPTTYINNFRAMMRTINHDGSPQYMESTIGPYYSIMLTFKGVQLTYEKIIQTLYFFDLSNNAFEGEIPEYVGQLAAIQGLNLSHNRLTGHIPPSMGSLSSLDSLDLSSNMLSGRIPHELVSLTFLEVFNVSENQLEGPVPQGNNFDTFSSDSYKGNLALCGKPLPVCRGNSTPFVNNNEDDSEDHGSILKEWETIVTGFCSGFVVGLAWGYYMFSVGKPFWFIKLADKMELALLDYFGTNNLVRRRGRAARTTRN